MTTASPFLDFLRDYYEAGDNVHSEEGDKHSSMFEVYDELKEQEAFWRIVQENIREWWD